MSTLESEIDKAYSELYDLMVHCAISNVQNKFRFMNAPGAHKIIEHRDHLNYRMGGVQLHLKSLRAHLRSYCDHFQANFFKVQNDPQFQRDSSFIISYHFDDLIFNLVSYFDYLGNYMGVLLIGGKEHNVKWNGIMNHVRAGNIEQENICEILNETHNKWANKLIKYRGDLIHRKSMVGEMENGWSFSKEGGVETYMRFYIPPQLKKDFHIFRNENDVEVLEAAERIVKISLEYSTAIVSTLKELEFEKA